MSVRIAPHYNPGRMARASLGHEILEAGSTLGQHAICVGPKFMPQAETDEVVTDFLINEIHIKNGSNATATVWVKDRQIPPCDTIPALQLPPGGMISMESRPGYFSPGGLTWYSSQPGVTCYAIGTVAA